MSARPSRGLHPRLREWLRPPRRLRLQRGGTVLILGVFGLGIATLNTGNNLLYLLVGALLGLIALSGWLSEKSISGILIERRVPRAGTAGEPIRIEYRIQNRKSRLASAGIELRETPLTRKRRGAAVETLQTGYAPLVVAGETTDVSALLRAPRRGLYRLERLVVSTAFPFGLFIKERDLVLPGTLLVRPRADRQLPATRPAGRGGEASQGSAGALAGGERGEYRGLRPYRSGDDPRDVHWRSSARRAEPIVREYDQGRTDTYWIVLDLSAPTESAGEVAVEIAASLAASASVRGERFGFAAGESILPPDDPGTQLEAVLDLLARVELVPVHRLVLPASPADCVLVTAGGNVPDGLAGVLEAREQA